MSETRFDPDEQRREALACHSKVESILAALVGDRAQELRASLVNKAAVDAAYAALAPRYGDNALEMVAHLLYPSRESAFLLAFFFYPDRFTPAEIRAGFHSFFAHAPQHYVAAADAAGLKVTGMFDRSSNDAPTVA